SHGNGAGQIHRRTQQRRKGCIRGSFRDRRSAGGWRRISCHQRRKAPGAARVAATRARCGNQVTTMPALILAAIVAATGTDPYVRSHTNDGAHCLGWPTGSLVYNQSELGNPNGDNPFQAVTTSWQSWQAIQSSCGNLTLSEGPHLCCTTPGTPGRTASYDPSSNDN